VMQPRTMLFWPVLGWQFYLTKDVMDRLHQPQSKSNPKRNGRRGAGEESCSEPQPGRVTRTALIAQYLQPHTRRILSRPSSRWIDVAVGVEMHQNRIAARTKGIYWDLRF